MGKRIAAGFRRCHLPPLLLLTERKTMAGRKLAIALLLLFVAEGRKTTNEPFYRRRPREGRSGGSFAAGTEMPRGVGSAVHELRRCLAEEGGGRERTVGQLCSICFFESQQGRETICGSLSLRCPRRKKMETGEESRCHRKVLRRCLKVAVATFDRELAIRLLLHRRRTCRHHAAPPTHLLPSRRGNPKLTAGKLHRNAQASTPPGTSLLHGGCSCRYCLPRRY